MLSSSVEGLLKVASWCSGEMIQIAHQLPGDDVVPPSPTYSPRPTTCCTDLLELVAR